MALQLLLAAGCDPSLKDHTGMTPLAVAAWMGKEKCLDFYPRDREQCRDRGFGQQPGRHAPHLRPKEDHEGIAERLIAAGASLDAEDMCVYRM